MIKINLNFQEYLELERLKDGSFFPVNNFMTKNEAINVINNLKFKKNIFPLPILLPISEDCYTKITTKKNTLNLFFKNQLVGKILNPEVFKLDLIDLCKKIFNTTSDKHPGVLFYKNKSNIFVGGKTILLKKVFHEFKKYELSPKDVKKTKLQRNIKTLVGFQTRNVPHRAHEFLIRNAIENYDAIFIQPLIGQKKSGDYLPDVIMYSFKILLNKFLVKKKVILGSLTTFMRYAGPREALFHAIIRKNYGCTHFIVGRDHAGVGGFYNKLDAQKLVQKYEKQINIKIIDSTGPFYCNVCNVISTNKICKHKLINQKTEISGTYIRNLFKKGKTIDNRLINKKLIIDLRKKFKNIFI